ncbi:MAG: hypothetical protein KY469_01640 [Actinobacteria bacterium]|nr:hypothetical protein [Actinomycetota bacterium]
MFTQVIEGRVDDAAALRQQLDRWVADLAPSGWLGTTAGVTTDDDAIIIVRFATTADAQATSVRPEQDAWWRDTQPLFTSPVTFRDCADTEIYLAGGSDDAGFVQVIRAGVADPHRQNELARELEALLPRHRPEIIGMTIARHEDGGMTQVVYFTDEQQARRGERDEPTGELAGILAEWRDLLDHPRYLDLTGPWLLSPVP